MKDRKQTAVQKFSQGYNCAQSVFSSFCDVLGIEEDTALKIACPFGGGMARMQEVCGAVTGAMMVLGAKRGRGVKEEPGVMDETYKKTRDLMERFNRKNGNYICRNLLGDCDLKSEQGQKYFKENDLRNKVCIPCVQSAVEILEEIY